MKKIISLVIITTLSVIIATIYPLFAAVDNKQSDGKGFDHITSRLDDENQGGGGGTTGIQKKYTKEVFHLKFEKGSSTNFDVSIDGGGAGCSTEYTDVLLSCCVRTIWWWNECDFSDESADCNKYINRNTGKPYTVNTYTYK